MKMLKKKTERQSVRTMNIFLIILFLLVSVILYCSYKSYFIQRDRYEGNIVMRLQILCSTVIVENFGEHAAVFDISKKKNYALDGVKSEFTITNDLLSLTVHGSSKIYFNGMAPQRVSCNAFLPYATNRIITPSTKVQYYFQISNGISKNFNGYLVSHVDSLNQYAVVLTMKQMEEIAPLVKLFPLEKPRYNILDFYFWKIK